MKTFGTMPGTWLALNICNNDDSEVMFSKPEGMLWRWGNTVFVGYRF